MNRRFIFSSVAVVVLTAACTPVPVKLSGEIDVNVNTSKADTTLGTVKSVTSVTIERVVGELDKCPKLDAPLVNTEASGGTKICYYITEQEI